ncbi:MAG: hypothetical protein H6996_07930 [Moraxellaceae bacterium]|nr:hypothetical protein [Pseudomonadales bacterium]MCP5175017.1 hypothetical protein [Moraxellaceae bacterium]
MKLTYRLLALPALIALLSACGEGSNTLTDPKISEAETTTTCQDKDFCISGQFVDEPVVGLNYICNLVEGITDDDGVFTCPNNSVATFFLKSATGNRKIIIGKYRVRTLGSDANSNLVKINLIVTPEDLLTSTDSNSSMPVQLSNVLRLLQALDSDGTTNNNTINRIVIDPKDKKAIDKLSADVQVSDFAKTAGQFDDLLKPMFDELAGKSISTITESQALARYHASLPTIHGGVYEVVPNVASVINSDSSQTFNGMFGRFNSSDLHSMAAMFFLIDREGKAIGNALEWQNTFTTEQLNNDLVQRRLLFGVAPTYLDFNSTETMFENNGKVKSNFILDSATGKIKLTQGTLQKGTIAGSDKFYRNAYGLTETDSIDSTKLGVWQRLGTDNLVQLTGAYNMQRNRDINMYLDASIWKTIDNVTVGEKPVFPLHLKLTLRDGDRTAACGGSTGNGCLLGEMGISILGNGNIITDRDNNCSAVDALTLQDSSTAMQEHRLGLVATVLRDNTQKAVPLIAPLMMVGSWARQLPNTDTWSKFYGIYMGASSGFPGGTKVQIDISRVLDKIVKMQHQPDEQESFGVTPVWTNYVKSMQSYSMSATDKTAIKPALSGLVSNVQVQSCYNPQPKQ